MPMHWQGPLAIVPSANPELLAVTACSTVLFTLCFYTVQYVLGRKPIPQTERQKSWVLTTVSSAATTLLSLPFAASWFKTGQPLDGGRAAEYGCAFFIGYLVCDLAIGSLHYRSSISLLTGWIHHLVYILLISLVVLPYGYSSLFSLCFILELPTFLLAIANLNKAFRNDYLFAVVFFLTRIVLHIQVAVTYGWRAYYLGGTWVPTIVLSCVLPMHIVWMKGSITGILRRRAAAAEARKLATCPKSTSGAEVPTWPIARIRTIPSYLLSRPLVVSAIDGLSVRRLTLPRSRQRMLRFLETIRDVDTPVAAGEHVTHNAGLSRQQAVNPTLDEVVQAQSVPRWRSIRRRVVGRIRRSLPEMYGYGVNLTQLSEPIEAATVRAHLDPEPVAMAN